MPDHAFVPAPVSAGSGGGPAADASGRILLTAWVDPVVDRRGHDPRSRYVERFWLGVLGPSATWLVRRLTDELERSERRDSAVVDLVALARTMGMSYTPDRASPFAKAIHRCVMFGIAHHTPDGIAIRRRLPNVAERHLRRLPPTVAGEHDRWLEHHRPTGVVERARRIGRAMLDAGDCPGSIEEQLVAVGIDPATAGEVVTELRSAA